jgi:hypothetical protein
MLEIDLALPHSYSVTEPGELPGTGTPSLPVLYFPKPQNRSEHDGLWLRIKGKDGKPWIGVFAYLYNAPPAWSRVIGSLDPDRVCVIARGAGYIVDSNNPNRWENIAVNPVLDCRILMEHQLIIFAGFTHLAAYNSNGMAWQSPRVCWDELKILRITENIIEGTGYDPTSIGESRFVVDIKTGRSLLPAPVSIDGRSIW